MAKLQNYNGSVSLMAGITQKGGGNFAMVEANAVQTREDGTRLDAELEALQSSINEKADSEHTHDDLYYTEAEVDEAIANAIAEAQLNGGNVDLSNYYTKEEIDNLELITVEDIDTICGATT